MKKNLYSCLIISIIILYNPKVFAWDRKGHEIVAGIAMQYMNDKAKKEVLMLLEEKTPESAATWMDDVRIDHSFDYMSKWHYINFPKDTFYPAKTEENIITIMTSAYIGLLHKDKLSKDEKKFFILMLFHLVGDLHQPLHTGYADDQGGNSIKLLFLTDSTDLHHVWDKYIIKHENITLQSVEQRKSKLTEVEVRQIGIIDFMTWLSGSRNLLPSVYDFKGTQLDGTYSSNHKAEVEMQLLFAGIRLAALMNAVFS
jgi:hypothetical protein